MTEEIVTGEAGTAEDARWVKAAESLQPEKSVERADTLAKFIIANVSLVGLVLTGFGFLSDAQERLIANRERLMGPLVLLGISLVLAVSVLAPRLGTVNTDDVVSIRNWYQTAVWRKGIAIVLSFATFIAALILAIRVSTAVQSPVPSAGLSATWARAEGSRSFVADIQVQDMPAATTARARVVGVGQGERRAVLFRGLADARNGKAAFQIDVSKADRFRSFTLAAVILRDGEPIFREWLVIAGSMRSTKA